MPADSFTDKGMYPRGLLPVGNLLGRLARYTLTHV